MMSKKTKMLEERLTQVEQSNENLRSQLIQANEQLEIVTGSLADRNAKLSEVTAELSSLKSKYLTVTNELNIKFSELDSANKRLEEYRLRQDAIVNALTEAHATRDRIINEANENSNKIIDDANSEKNLILTSARDKANEIKREAESELKNARTEAGKIQSEALEEAAILAEAAESEAKALIEAAEEKVELQRKQLAKLNSSISAKAAMALEQTQLYVDMLNFIADAEEPALDEFDDDCEQDCQSCDNKCPECLPAVPCKTEESSEENECTPVDNLETCAPCGKSHTCCQEAKEDIQDNVPGESELNSANDQKTIAEGGDVGEFMRNLYTIEGRDIPCDDEFISDVGEGTPLVVENEEIDKESPLPTDADLAEILSDIL